MCGNDVGGCVYRLNVRRGGKKRAIMSIRVKCLSSPVYAVLDKGELLLSVLLELFSSYPGRVRRCERRKKVRK